MSDKNSVRTGKGHRDVPSVETKPTSKLSAAPLFTAGPWYLGETARNTLGVFSQYQPMAIAEVSTFPLLKKKNADANARLIAAAPALYQEASFAVANGKKWTLEDWQNWITNHARQRLHWQTVNLPRSRVRLA